MPEAIGNRYRSVLSAGAFQEPPTARHARLTSKRDAFHNTVECRLGFLHPLQSECRRAIGSVQRIERDGPEPI